MAGNKQRVPRIEMNKKYRSLHIEQCPYAESFWYRIVIYSQKMRLLQSIGSAFTVLLRGKRPFLLKLQSIFNGTALEGSSV